MRRITRTTTVAISAVAALAAVTACSTQEEPAAQETATEATTGEEEATESDDMESEDTESEDMESESEDMDDDSMGPVLGTADSELGEIVVDGVGMTVYFFDNDEPGSGTSACEGDCLAAWPPVHAGSEEPEVEGVTAEVGTITGNDGELQVTLDGRPVYLFANDAAPGEVSGQGVNDVWWVVAPDGSAVTEGGGGY
ncbi:MULTISPECIES: hypothetical protein [unclassified Isoptericola]|uniref:COG4315 family predicted lipoprotein n=1 Tax=unclassified Isoptericola TaxID=2623355 RepID=UPI002712E9AF|nr:MULTISPECIES: hypothetical protein [unclassified Isoptericola]MDO8145791.1 hypothetical protein [Isoptericola sp. 178]MDO8149871.1 hypothetical protein [Isoptericola sp. b408]